MKRRQEVRGVAAGVTVIDDFGHHPTAIRETLVSPLRKRAEVTGKIVSISDEPRSATSSPLAAFQADLARRVAARLRRGRSIGRLARPEKDPRRPTGFDPEKLAADLRSRGTAAV